MEALDIVDTKLLIEQIVWAYSERLQSDTEPDELERFQSVLANTLLRSSHIELKRHPRRSFAVVGSEELARRDRMKEAVQRGIASESHLLPIPVAIAFWPLDAKHRPKERIGIRALPAPLKGQFPRSVFKSADGKQSYGYFEIASLDTDLPLVTSAFASAPSRSTGTKAKPRQAFLFGLIGLVLFVISMSSVYATGELIGAARNQVSDAVEQFDEAAPSERWSGLRAALDAKCKPPNNASEGPSLGGLCDNSNLATDQYEACINSIAPDEEQEVSSLTPACNFVWEEALLIADSTRNHELTSTGGKLDWVATRFEAILSFARLTSTDLNRNDAMSLSAYAYLSIASLILLFCAFGFGTKGRWCGLVISEQNRVSLSLSQITAWTIVLLSSYAVYAAFNVGSLPGYSTSDLSLFPALPAWTWAVMGITVAAPFASSLIKGSAPEGWEEHFKAASDATGQSFEVRSLEFQSSEEDARLSNLITSEEIGKGDQLAITRVQNVIITATLLFTYTAWLVGSISALVPSFFLTAFAENNAVLPVFPEPDATFTALLALSHGAYLLGKFQPAAKGDADP